ncbi:3-deoxy-D-manno-octulosonic acid transferase [Polynucleobacter sp. AP-Jannik-300A-C4]|uniref:3-deoxy-D-manno-octulosonic acid transferase n=1 Tax=Polynucleobacter sp. AP-Jannik-300A-C4 TaxID=2576928 RepID=UPI0020401D71|nr:3-deoxy-D-manno-octulosonic acid transferase [Polynucleobacter sp. AP-Jannik-300A-C4]QWE22349.1 3-deoxy-D-manno-octulosonic acid transferase [Polynucleobacter sp. AP-Jannik-300A-C4]
MSLTPSLGQAPQDLQYGARPKIWFAVYQLLWHLLLPLAFLRLAWRTRHSSDYLNHFTERLGFAYGKTIIQGSVWIHAVSVGETRAAQPLVDAYLERGETVLLTHMTLNGRRTGTALFAKAIAAGQLRQVYLPYDLCWSVANFIRAFKPKFGLFMETEAWPTIVFYCAEIRLPLFLVNARLSERSARRVNRFGKAGRSLFQAFAGILAQTQFDADRYRSLGVKKVEIVGNLKFDVPLDPSLVQQGKSWKQELHANQRLMVCAASTRDGEEVIILQAWKDLLLSNTFDVAPLLCLVPRHPERFSEVADQIRDAGLKFLCRTEWIEAPKGDANVDVILGDSMGEMPMYYSAADLVLMGGSLLPFGGQNLIEACAAGCPVLLGEHTYNFQQAALDAIAIGAAKRIQGELILSEPVALIESLKELLLNTTGLEMMSSAAKAYSIEHQGATKKILAALEHQNFTLN